jgi:hypothetical protein
MPIDPNTMQRSSSDTIVATCGADSRTSAEARPPATVGFNCVGKTLSSV